MAIIKEEINKTFIHTSVLDEPVHNVVVIAVDGTVQRCKPRVRGAFLQIDVCFFERLGRPKQHLRKTNRT